MLADVRLIWGFQVNFVYNPVIYKNKNKMYNKKKKVLKSKYRNKNETYSINLIRLIYSKKES